MASTYANLIFHIVFSTKNRASLIKPELTVELYKYIAGIIKSEGAMLLKIGGTENHVHLVTRLKPTHSIPDLLRKIKANSSKWINENNKTDSRFSWQSGYGVFSVSESQLESLIDYTSNQKKHHHRKYFKEEFIQLLEKHKIKYELEYLWE